MKQSISIIVFALIFISFGVGLGIIGTNIYELSQDNYEKQYNGLWLKGYNESQAKQITLDKDKGGDWVCVNVREMTFHDLVKTCIHEAGHELFAEMCEADPNKCFDEVDELI